MFQLHQKAFDATGDGNPKSFCVYEHVLIAEEIIDRPLKEGEVVHHLDKQRCNNSPDNLLVISNPMHMKLHGWMDKHEIIPNERQEERIKLGCIRCEVCEKPISYGFRFCSLECSSDSNHKYKHPTKEILEKLVWEKPTTKIAEDFGVSDKAIEKLCKKLEVEKPPRGHWQKVKYSEK